MCKILSPCGLLFRLFVAVTCFSPMLMVNESQGATITRDDHYPFYSDNLVQYVASKGTFPALVIANPFGAGADRDLLTNLEMPGGYPPTPFSRTTPTARDDGHLVLIFNPVQSSNGPSACASPSSQAALSKSRSASPLRLQIAFCYDNEVVSEAYMEMQQPSGLGDRVFHQDMAQLLNILLPIENPNRGDCGNSTGGNC